MEQLGLPSITQATTGLQLGSQECPFAYVAAQELGLQRYSEVDKTIRNLHSEILFITDQLEFSILEVQMGFRRWKRGVRFLG